jgi:hypothetical protein
MLSVRVLAAAALVIGPAHLTAQTTSTEGAQAAVPLVEQLPVGAQCLTRGFKDSTGADRSLTIVVPTADATRYSEKKFTAGACGQMSVAEYRARTCRLALQGNDAVQKRLEQVLGAAPRALCDAVKAVAPFPKAEAMNAAAK